MQLKLTWRIKKEQDDINLMVSANQTIKETMQVLVGKGYLKKEIAETVNFVKSLRSNNQVNILLTYSEAEIYSGDILELIIDENYNK